MVMDEKFKQTVSHTYRKNESRGPSKLGCTVERADQKWKGVFIQNYKHKAEWWTYT